MTPILFKSVTRKGNELAAICGGADGRRPGDAIALMGDLRRWDAAG
jgi:hypothetical protein